MTPYSFQEEHDFQRNWRRLRLTDDDLFALQFRLMANPNEGKVIPGSDGLRKIRIRIGSRGKRGGGRVVYAIYHEDQVISMVDVYSKND